MFSGYGVSCDLCTAAIYQHWQNTAIDKGFFGSGRKAPTNQPMMSKGTKTKWVGKGMHWEKGKGKGTMK